MRGVGWILVAALAGQAGLGWLAGGARFTAEAVPPAPSAAEIAAASFGDAQFYYRRHGLRLQNFGDTGGRVTPLAALDYARLGSWFDRLDALDPRAAYVPVVAAYFYGQSQNPDDVRVVAKFLIEAAARDPERRWPLLAHAVFLARHRIGDEALAQAAERRLAAIAAAFPHTVPANPR